MCRILSSTYIETISVEDPLGIQYGWRGIYKENRKSYLTCITDLFKFHIKLLMTGMEGSIYKILSLIYHAYKIVG